ncbi:MAG: hypothetical protein QOH46_4094 [Solirubrobacteraceae bacterium]|jgi:hypothetical protein|nr:hypothetical protein [Solirubrobacteraceae bacterium]
MSARTMAAQQPTLGHPAVNRTPLLAIVLSVVALAAGGIAVSVGLIQRGDDTPAIPELKGPFGVSQDIPTSFGAVAIDNIEKVNGVTAKDLSGVTHGISNYVPPNKTQVQASVTMTNLLGDTVGYSPTQFRLLVGKNKKPVGEVRASFRPGTLQPDASISGQLKFIAPRNGSKLWIEFTDPKRSTPVLVDLGKTGTTPDSAFDGFHKKH